MPLFEPILISPFFLDFVLPFTLVFTLIFAILQKTKLLGDDVKQINALISLVTGLILIAFPYPRSIIVLLMPFLAVSAVILMVFMLLYGFIVAKKDDVLGDKMKIAFGIILGIAMIVVLLIITGFWPFVYDMFFGNSDSSKQILINGVLVIVIIGAIIAVVRGGSDSGGKKSE